MKRILKYVLILVPAYYLVGFGLFFSGVIKKFPVFYHTVLTVKEGAFKDDDSKASADGPFVFYRGDKVLIKSVIKKDTGFVAWVDTAVDRQIRLMCKVDSMESFEVTLQDCLMVQQTEYELPSKMLVISDIEGNFYGFKSILTGAGIIDQKYNWVFGSGHLVLVGDFFDRGLNVTETLWLVYRLEREAEKAGGKVHFILGNHEMMNLYGNTRYVRNKYKENAKILGEPYGNWYTGETELGRWLRTKNVVEKIGDLVFVHGGISTELVHSGLTLQQMNQVAREHIGKPLDSISSATAKLIYDTKVGPFWYRGFVKNEVSEEEVKQVLQYLKASRLVIGHTIVDEITTFYQNKIIAIDVDHAGNFKEKRMKALWIENGSFYLIDHNGAKKKLM